MAVTHKVCGQEVGWYGDNVTESANPNQPHTCYDYENQAWLVNGRYVSCSHPAAMDCQCYGKVHTGEWPQVKA